MKIETGTPAEDGRYVVFTLCRAMPASGWCEPHIATWQGGHWHFRWHVLGWSGPIPVCQWKDFKQEYDL